MKQFISFVKKEILHILRDRLTLSIMVALPVVMLLILGYAVSTDINNVPFVVLDKAKSQMSLNLVQKFDHNKYFSKKAYVQDNWAVEKAFQRGEVKIAIVIPSTLSSDIQRGEGTIQLLMDASNPNEASTISNYAQSIVLQFIQEQYKTSSAGNNIQVEVKMLYNPQMESSYNMVPGLIGMLMILICALMTSISVVREKELGTMEILLTSPLKPTTIIIAKALPYLAVGLFDNVLVLGLAYFVLGVPIAGNVLLVLSLAFIFTFCALALGLLISTLTNTQQSAMLAAGAGLMLPAMLLSGMIFPINSMAFPLQVISCLNPVRWFVAAIRNVMIKGVGISEIWMELLILLCMTVFLMTISIKKFKNRL